MSDVTLQRMRQYARIFPPQGPHSEAAAALVRRMHPLQLVAGPHAPTLTTALSAALAPLEAASAVTTSPAGMLVCLSQPFSVVTVQLCTLRPHPYFQFNLSFTVIDTMQVL